MREALFSILASDDLVPEGGRVLDLYAGTGALSFEALSRGMGSAVVVEQARDALAVIKENALALGAGDRLRVVASRVDRALATMDGGFDLILLDPPYADVRTPAFGDVLAAAAKLLEPDGALVLEHASSDEPPPISGLDVDRSRRYGDTTITLYRPSTASEAL